MAVKNSVSQSVIPGYISLSKHRCLFLRWGSHPLTARHEPPLGICPGLRYLTHTHHPMGRADKLSVVGGDILPQWQREHVFFQVQLHHKCNILWLKAQAVEDGALPSSSMYSLFHSLFSIQILHILWQWQKVATDTRNGVEITVLRKFHIFLVLQMLILKFHTTFLSKWLCISYRMAVVPKHSYFPNRSEDLPRGES